MKYMIGDFTFEICAEEGMEFPEHFSCFRRMQMQRQMWYIDWKL